MTDSRLRHSAGKGVRAIIIIPLDTCKKGGIPMTIKKVTKKMAVTCKCKSSC